MLSILFTNGIEKLSFNLLKTKSSSFLLKPIFISLNPILDVIKIITLSNLTIFPLLSFILLSSKI